MKKVILLFLLSFWFIGNTWANPGDTTWVQANIKQLTYNGNYDTIALFPSSTLPTTYRRIYMIFTLGKYQCPGSPQYCGDWDYTIDNYLMTKNGDTVDLGRLITPYANAGAPRTPWTWTQRYIYDVTDFYPILKDSATVRVAYSGYSGGFTANIKFAFIEGIPDRYVSGIKRLWHGYFGYGGASNTMNTHFPIYSGMAPFNTESATLKFIVTGHGSDANQCCEFMPHFYKTYVDGNQLDSITIWRPDCGLNELYPQSGTWIYERANWCPGALVNAHYHAIPGITASTTHNFQIFFDSTYTSNGGGGYGCDATLFYYQNFNKPLDAAIESVINPTNYEGHFRENPACGNPVIHIKNTGAATISNLSFSFGLKDSVLSTYNWTGSLAAQQEADINLPDLLKIDSLSEAARTDTFNFIAIITSVNGVHDYDATNDTIYSKFKVAPTWPNPFIVTLRTNNAGVNGVNSGESETTWTIYDMNNNVINSRLHSSLNTLYNDTITLSQPGCYKLVVNDLSCDGLQWWVHSQDNSGINSGYIEARRATTGTLIPLNGNVYSGTYGNDFGCGFTQYFTNKDATTSLFYKKKI